MSNVYPHLGSEKGPTLPLFSSKLVATAPSLGYGKVRICPCFHANWSLPLPVWGQKKSEFAPVFKQIGRYRSPFGVRKNPNLPLFSRKLVATAPSLESEKVRICPCFQANWSLPLPVWGKKKFEFSPVFKQTGRYRSQFGVRESPNLPLF